MLLIYTQKSSYRISYVFKHICTRVLGIEVDFTSVIEEFISHKGPKLSYCKKPLGNELFIQSYGLLTQQGFESIDIAIRNWEETKCFFSASEKSGLPFDMFSASFYLLSRYEEYLPHVKDEKGRFLASESLAYKEKFLQYPMVDIWAYKFKELLVKTFPQIQFAERKMIFHNLVDASQPFAYKQKGFLRSISGFFKDVFKFKIRNAITRCGVVLGFKEDPFNNFDWIIQTVKGHKTKLTLFFLLGEAINFIEGTNSKREKFKLLIKTVSDYKQVGLIFSKESLKNYEFLKKEKKQLEKITNRDLVSSMNTQYMLSLPDNYRNLIELEVEKDFSMVYENQSGFRASSCTPFLFYDLDYEIVSPLLIHPIALTTLALNGQKESEVTQVIEDLIASVKKVNGTFSMVFTNRDFNSKKINKKWRHLFVRLSKGSYSKLATNE